MRQGASVVATLRDLDKEQPLFEKRVFGAQTPESHEVSLGNFRGRKYDDTDVVVTSFDVLKDDLPSLLRVSGTLDHVVNAVNLGTLFGLKVLKGDHPDLFRFSHMYHTALEQYARETNVPLRHLLVSTTGSGGIGLERMRISHNREEHGIPASIVQKSACAAALRNSFRDFQRTSNRYLTHHALVPACAIVDLESYQEPVEVYGDYRSLQDGRFIKRYSPRIVVNGVERQGLQERGFLEASYGLFGEDGPHTVADLQQLQMFMGVTTATKIAEIIQNTLQRSGAYNYDVLSGGNDIPEMSEYVVHGFEKRVKRSEGQPVTLSPIAPFDIPLHCFAYELLALAGLETMHDLCTAPVDDSSLENLAQRIVSRFETAPHELIAGTSLGVTYRFQTPHLLFEAYGPFERGIFTNETLRSCIHNAQDFERERKHSQKLDDFFATYDSRSGMKVQDVIGYLAAYPVAKQMRKEGHF